MQASRDQDHPMFVSQLDQVEAAGERRGDRSLEAAVRLNRRERPLAGGCGTNDGSRR